jgi:hypothetical protein
MHAKLKILPIMPPRKYTHNTYTDEQREEFCALAQVVGIGRAIRELGYPSYPTAMTWLDARGIEPNVDKVMARVKNFHTFYDVQDLLMIIDETIATIEEMVANVTNADDVVKLATALQKAINSRQILENKATTIVEKREMSQTDIEIAELIRDQERMNAEIKTKISQRD